MLRGLFVCLAVIGASAINFQIYPNQEKCFFIKGDGQYHIQYVASGKNENLTIFTIKQGDRQLHKIEGAEHYETFNLPGGGGVGLCWSTPDDTLKLISATFFEAQDPIRSLITKNDIAAVEKALSQAANDLSTVSRNQLYQHERDNVHKTVLQETDTKIVYAGVIKIAVMLTSVVLQIWIMRGFFKNTGISYSEVAT